MTYCVGLLLKEGMVLLSDTRTNAGLDNISCYKKMYTFEDPGERSIVILTAGSLSVTQTTMARLQEAIDDAEATEETSILKARTMLKVADIVGAHLAEVASDITMKLVRNSQATASATLILGGQRKGGAMRLFLIYPEGNYIEATPDTPFLQVGEHKYGKPILDRVVTPDTSLTDARKAALLSMDSTLRSNLSVGMPLDLAVIREGECRIHEQRRIEYGDPVFAEMSQAWSAALRDAFTQIRI
ncbi:peptidase [Meridianimarinicoccus roseus]|jgi:putative proteasome-type protease|uniref:Peptidase n=1 Tax=Meridianimarinicoccus roseus TaxID=2072018 RepID=A0A2V2LJ65_9RHOB|nr:peptidase [Meridianimarinicoccus roseus]PWR04091.1 peptidase [Meridianimarinicoccus roseus]